MYKMKIETVSNKNYLKKYQIKSPLIKNYSVLNSSISYEKFSDEYSFSSSIDIIEDLSKEKNDSYEYSYYYKLVSFCMNLWKYLTKHILLFANFRLICI